MDDAKTALREARKTTVPQQQQQRTYGDDELMTDERENVAKLSTVHGCVVDVDVSAVSQKFESPPGLEAILLNSLCCCCCY